MILPTWLAPIIAVLVIANVLLYCYRVKDETKPEQIDIWQSSSDWTYKGKTYEVHWANTWASGMNDIIAWLREPESDHVVPVFRGETFTEAIEGDMPAIVKESFRT